MLDYEALPHTADLKIRVYGDTPEQLFKHAVIGMFQSIGPQNSACTKKGDRLICPVLPEKHDVTVASMDQEALLVDFLSEALYFSDIYNEAYLDVTVHKLTDTTVHATLFGIKTDGFEVVEIKAVTYHDLSIRKKDNRWVVEIVFDI